jgi:hypothetical protein
MASAFRAQLVYDRNREFVEGLGLDAVNVLGERPVPATDGAPARVYVPTLWSRDHLRIGWVRVRG